MENKNKINKSTYLLNQKFLSDKEVQSVSKETTLLLNPATEEDAKKADLLNKLGLNTYLKQEENKVKVIKEKEVLKETFETDIHKSDDVFRLALEKGLHYIPTQEYTGQLPSKIIEDLYTFEHVNLVETEKTKNVKSVDEETNELVLKQENIKIYKPKAELVEEKLAILTDDLSNPKSFSLYLDEGRKPFWSDRNLILIGSFGGNFNFFKTFRNKIKFTLHYVDTFAKLFWFLSAVTVLAMILGFKSNSLSALLVFEVLAGIFLAISFVLYLVYKIKVRETFNYSYSFKDLKKKYYNDYDYKLSSLVLLFLALVLNFGSYFLQYNNIEVRDSRTLSNEEVEALMKKNPSWNINPIKDVKENTSYTANRNFSPVLFFGHKVEKTSEPEITYSYYKL